MAKVSQTAQPLTITSPLGEDVLLLEAIEGTEALSQPFSFKLELVSMAENKFTFDKILGQPVTVKITRADCPDRFIHGIVNSFAQGHRLAGMDGAFSFNSFEATIVPSVWFLQKQVRSRIFQQKSVPDILKEVFTGLKVTYQIDGDFKPRDYCTQYRESDFAFASRLMEEEGIYYFFKHTKSGHEMVLANTPARHPATETAEFPFDEGRGGIREKDAVNAWTKRQTFTPGKVTLRDHHFELSNTDPMVTKPILDKVQAGTVSHALKVGGNDKYEIYEHPGRVAQRFDGIAPGSSPQAGKLNDITPDNDRTAGIRAQELVADGLVIEGAGDARLFSAGFKFKLTEHFDANGSYVLTEVHHKVLQRGQYTGHRAEGGQSFHYENSFRCIPEALPFRPARVTPKARVEGPHTAIVVGPAGEEIFTDKYGRVKVQFPWDRDGKKDATSSCWIRVGTPWAGQQWGMIHIPRIGQEVIVSFEEGDPDQPLIVGSVYNAANMPPYTLPDMKTQSGIKSRSTLKGTAEHFNELRFEDKKDSEDIYFHGQKDFHRVVENDDDLKVGRHQTREIKNNRTSVIKEGNDVFTIEKGSRTETLKDGDETITLEKGARSHKIQTSDKLEVVQGGRSVKTLGDHALEVTQGNGSITLSQGNYTLDVKMGGITIKADLGKIGQEAMESISLKVGGSMIKVDGTGITLQGPQIKIMANATLMAKAPITNVMADGILVLKGGLTKIG